MGESNMLSEIRFYEPALVSRFRENILLLISGILLTAAFPPVNFGFLAYFALVPFFIVLHRHGRDYKSGFLAGFKLGVIFHSGTIHWIAFNTGTEWQWATLSMIGAIIWASLFFAFFGAGISLLYWELGEISFWFAPPLFTIIEFIRGYGMLAFTWPSLAHTQVYSLLLLQPAAVTGIYGLTFWIVILNTLLFYCIFLEQSRSFRARTVLLTIIVFLIVPLSGAYRLFTEGNRKDTTVRVGCIQPNVDPREKWVRMNLKQNIDMLYLLSDSILSKSSVDLIVWPETAMPTYLKNNYRRRLDRMWDYVNSNNVAVFTGVPDYEKVGGKRKYFNAAYYFAPGEKNYKIYRKQKLVPFGEFIPFSDLFPSLNNLNLGQGNFSAGNEMVTFDVPMKKAPGSFKFCGVICYESIFPYIVREGAHDGANLLAIITNDAWFGKSLGPYQHAAFARFRAVENGIPVVRSANTGISEIIDPFGRILAKAPFGKQAILTSEVPLNFKTTIYTRWGEWFPKLLVIIMFIFINYLIIRRRYERK